MAFSPTIVKIRVRALFVLFTLELAFYTFTRLKSKERSRRIWYILL